MTSDDDEAITRSKDWFVERLSAYGIGEDRIHVTYQDFLQDYEITISGGLLTEEQVEGVQKVTRDGGCVVFENSENAGCMPKANIAVRADAISASLSLAGMQPSPQDASPICAAGSADRTACTILPCASMALCQQASSGSPESVLPGACQPAS